MSITTLEVRSLITPEGELRLTLEEVAVPAPRPCEVVVRVDAAPINPSDVGELLGPADATTLKTSGPTERPVTSAKIPSQFISRITTRMGQSMSVGNECCCSRSQRPAAYVDVDRNLLILMDFILVLVLGLLLYAISARDPLVQPNVFDRLQLVLVVSALAVDVLMLVAMLTRIAEWGFTPNKVAALGMNVVLLVNLIWSARLLIGFLRGRCGFSAMEGLAAALPGGLRHLGGARGG